MLDCRSSERPDSSISVLSGTCTRLGTETDDKAEYGSLTERGRLVQTDRHGLRLAQNLPGSRQLVQVTPDKFIVLLRVV
jgi:hypothetical protein